MDVMSGFIQIVNLLKENPHFAEVGTRIVNSVRNAEESVDLYAVAKFSWKIIGKHVEAARALTTVLARHYPALYKAWFGEDKALLDAADIAEPPAESIPAESIPAEVKEEEEEDPVASHGECSECHKDKDLLDGVCDDCAEEEGEEASATAPAQ